MDPFQKKMLHESGNCLRTLKAAQQNPDKENLHLFRLAVKQLKAFSHVIEFPGKKNAHAKTFEYLQKCFQTAGVIRKVELQVERLSTSSDIGLINLIQKNKNIADKAKLKFKQTLESANPSDLLKFQIAFSYELEKLSSRQFLLKLNKSLQNNLKKLNKLAVEKPLRKNLHDMRIIIRRLIELLNVLEFFEKNRALNGFHDLLKSLNKKIGNWHDAESLHKTLRRYPKKHSETVYSCNDIISQLETEMATLEKEIKDLLTKGLESA